MIERALSVLSISKVSATVAQMKIYAGFISSFVRSPRSVGSICPSSRFLVRGLIENMPERSGIILDLGSGTGIVSSGLLQHDEHPSSIVAIERDPDLAEMIREKYPEITTLEADACHLRDSLSDNGLSLPVRAVISSLPFRSLPSELSANIAAEIMELMQKQGGLLIQYSYAWWMKFPLQEYGFIPVKRQFVFRNLPPAVVEVYCVPAATSEK